MFHTENSWGSDTRFSSFVASFTKLVQCLAAGAARGFGVTVLRCDMVIAVVCLEKTSDMANPVLSDVFFLYPKTKSGLVPHSWHSILVKAASFFPFTLSLIFQIPHLYLFHSFPSFFHILSLHFIFPTVFPPCQSCAPPWPSSWLGPIGRTSAALLPVDTGKCLGHKGHKGLKGHGVMEGFGALTFWC